MGRKGPSQQHLFFPCTGAVPEQVTLGLRFLGSPGAEAAAQNHSLAMPGVLAAPSGAHRRVAQAPVLVQAREPGWCQLGTPHLPWHGRSQADGKPGQDRHGNARGSLTRRARALTVRLPALIVAVPVLPEQRLLVAVPWAER